MIHAIFTHGNEVIHFTIAPDKTIRYADRKWTAGIQFIPKDNSFVRTVIMSRNRISQQMVQWIEEANTGTSLEEWNSCKTDMDVLEIIKRDAALKGCVFRKIFTDEEMKQAQDKLADVLPTTAELKQMDQVESVEQKEAE